MRGCISVEIPTKQYIKAYIIGQLGEKPYMHTSHFIGNKLIDLLEHKTNEYGAVVSCQNYNCTLRIYISQHTFKQRGYNLNATNIRNFNLFMQDLIKDRMRFLLDFYIFEMKLPSIKSAIAKAKATMKIEDELWDELSIEKDYLRYRKKNNLPLMYNKSLPQLSFL